MFHSGDVYEIRARATRHQELRRLARAVFGLFHRRDRLQTGQQTLPLGGIDCANDQALTTHRAA